MRLFWLSLCVILAAATLVLNLRASYYQYFSQSWPQSTAQIIESGLRKSWWPGRYQARIRYRYDVAECSYHGERLAFRAWSWPLPPAQAQSLSRAYPPGQFVTVRHHPLDSAFSVLAHTRSSTPMATHWLTSLLLCAGVVLLARRKPLRVPNPR